MTTVENAESHYQSTSVIMIKLSSLLSTIKQLNAGNPYQVQVTNNLADKKKLRKKLPKAKKKPKEEADESSDSTETDDTELDDSDLSVDDIDI